MYIHSLIPLTLIPLTFILIYDKIKRHFVFNRDTYIGSASTVNTERLKFFCENWRFREILIPWFLVTSEVHLDWRLWSAQFEHEQKNNLKKR